MNSGRLTSSARAVPTRIRLRSCDFRGVRDQTPAGSARNFSQGCGKPQSSVLSSSSSAGTASRLGSSETQLSRHDRSEKGPLTSLLAVRQRIDCSGASTEPRPCQGWCSCDGTSDSAEEGPPARRTDPSRSLLRLRIRHHTLLDPVHGRRRCRRGRQAFGGYEESTRGPFTPSAHRNDVRRRQLRRHDICARRSSKDRGMTETHSCRSTGRPA